MDTIHVDCYSGHRADERPLKFSTRDRTYVVERLDDKWYSPGATFFRVLADDGNIYVLKHDEVLDLWQLDAFRAQR